MRVSKNGKRSSISPSKICKPRALDECFCNEADNDLTQSSVKFQTGSPAGRYHVVCDSTLTPFVGGIPFTLSTNLVAANNSFGNQDSPKRDSKRERSTSRTTLGAPTVFPCGRALL